MIVKRQQLDISGKPVFEKLQIQPPLRYSAIFPNEACFLHFKGGDISRRHAYGRLHARPEESILLNCGTYFADLVQPAGAATMEVLAIHLHEDMLTALYANENFPSAYAKRSWKEPASLANTAVIDAYAVSLDNYFDNPALATPELMVLKLKEFLLLMLQTGAAESLYALFSQLFSPAEKDFKRIIQAHLYADISVQELAALAGQSVSTFKRTFEKLYNDSPASYIRQKKLDAAAQMLSNTSLSITEISYRAGFKDLSHFSRLFQQFRGMRPLAFRQKLHLIKDKAI